MNNNVYFGKEGITSTEGNFLCNIAKELQQSAIERLNNVKFYNTLVSVIGSNEKQIMSKGNENIDFIQNDLETIALLNSFCAWVREAIKEKELQTNTINNTFFSEWCKLNNIITPQLKDKPSAPDNVDQIDILSNWDINKQNKYLKLEAFAATIGKYIHPDGKYSNARKNAHENLNNPISKEGSGRDTVFYHTNPSIEIEKIDELFLELQTQHRNYEKELNQMKAELKDSMNDLSRKLNEEYQSKLDIWEKQYNEYNLEIEKLKSEFKTWKVNELERVSKLKIIIPDALKETFKMIKEVTSK